MSDECLKYRSVIHDLNETITALRAELYDRRRDIKTLQIAKGELVKERNRLAERCGEQHLMDWRK